MIKSALKLLEERPPHAETIFAEKYQTLLEDLSFLMEILKLEWSEETYKKITRLEHIIHNITINDRVSKSRDSLCYWAFSDYIEDWFHEYFKYLPFECWSHIGARGWDLCKELFDEKILKDAIANKHIYSKNDGMDRNYREFLYYDKKKYQQIYQQSEKEVFALLHDEKPLSLLLNTNKLIKQYDGLMDLGIVFRQYFAKEGREAYSKKVLPVYKYIYGYIWDWSVLYNASIYFEDWSDLAAEGIDLLKTMIKENTLKKFKTDERYKKLLNKISQRYNDLLERDYRQVDKVLRAGVDQKKVKPFLDGEAWSDFLQQNPRVYNIFGDVHCLVALTNQKWSEKKYDSIKLLTQICEEANPRRSREKGYFDILPIYHEFSECASERPDYFSICGVPFEEWECLAKEHDDLLKALIREHKLQYYTKDSRYKQWAKNFLKMKDTLYHKGYKRVRELEEEWEWNIGGY